METSDIFRLALKRTRKNRKNRNRKNRKTRESTWNKLAWLEPRETWDLGLSGDGNMRPLPGLGAARNFAATTQLFSSDIQCRSLDVLHVVWPHIVLAHGRKSEKRYNIMWKYVNICENMWNVLEERSCKSATRFAERETGSADCVFFFRLVQCFFLRATPIVSAFAY